MISIVIATFNGSKYIIEQLKSILNQTLKDFKMIVVDDASTDNTIELFENYPRASKNEFCEFLKQHTNYNFE